MNILVIANHLLTPKISSGGDRNFVEMVKRWRNYGAEVSLIVPEIALDDCASKLDPQKIISISPSRLDKLCEKATWSILPLYLFRTVKVFGLLHSIKTDAVYTTGDFFCDVIPAFYLKRKLGAKWVANIYHINDSPFVRRGNSFFAGVISFILQRISFALMKRSATVVFLLNQKVRNDLVKLGFGPGKLAVTGLGIDLKEIEKLKKVSAKEFEGCFLGRLNPTKGIFDLPKIWKKVVEKIPGAKLVIIGGGEKWLGELQSQIESLGLTKNIKIAGFVSEEEKCRLLCQSKVFVFPSYEEGWGIAAAEAMAVGLPVVAYDLPAYKEVFSDALMTNEVGDVEAMVKSILRLLQNRDEHEIWREKGYNVVRRYDLDTIAKTQWEIIMRLR